MQAYHKINIIKYEEVEENNYTNDVSYRDGY